MKIKFVLTNIYYFIYSRHISSTYTRKTIVQLIFSNTITLYKETYQYFNVPMYLIIFFRFILN